MIRKVLDKFNSLEATVKKIMKHGLYFCFFLAVLSCIVLITYEINPSKLDTYYIGIGLFQTSLTFAVEFLICGVAMDSIKKQMPS